MQRSLAFLVLSLALVSIAAAATGVGGNIGGLAAHDHSSAGKGGATLSNVASISVTGAVTSTKACQSGYTRKGPNFCGATTVAATTLLTRDACTAITPPTGAVMSLMEFALNANTANAVGSRNATISVYTDAACTTLYRDFNVGCREQVAAAAGTALCTVTLQPNVPLSSFWLKLQDDAGNQGTGGYSFFGYSD